MAFSEKIRSVTITDKTGNTVTYKHEGHDTVDGIACATITIDDGDRNIYYLRSLDKKVTVILPLKDRCTVEQFPVELPRFFVQYPLIGSEGLGINFIIHSRHFQPTEPRDSAKSTAYIYKYNALFGRLGYTWDSKYTAHS